MKARIYLQAVNAMQSGQKEPKWQLEFLPAAGLFVEPLMGWTGMTDTTQELRLLFDTKAAAAEYAERNGIEYELLPEPAKQKTLKFKSYAANFAYVPVAV